MPPDLCRFCWRLPGTDTCDLHIQWPVPKMRHSTQPAGVYETFPLHVQSTMIDTYLLADSDVHEFHVAC